MKTTDIIVIVGRRRAGKSYLVKKAIIPQLSSYVIDDHTMEYKQYGYTTTNPIDILNYRKVVFIDYKANDESFKEMIKYVFRRKQKYKTTMLIIEEAHVHFEKKVLPQAQSMLIRMGRHFNVGVILITQRVFDLNPNVLKNADYIILFKTREPRELDYIRKYITSEIVETVKNLPKYHFLIYDINENRYKVHKPI